MGNHNARNRPVFRQNQVFGGWRLTEKIGQGGNGQVWRAAHEKFGSAAIKLLRFRDEMALSRFKSEVSAMEKLRSIPGIMELYDSFIPSKLTDDNPWIVMPLASPIGPHLHGKDHLYIVEYFTDLAKTIAEVHELGISHRDIKPENILFLNGRLYLSDFGLVKFPNSPTVTKLKQDVGPKFTMAPEMRRSAYRADGRMADVFSFAKSLWIMLSGQPLGFDGQYAPGGILALRNFMPSYYTSGLINYWRNVPIMIRIDDPPCVR